MSEKPVVPASKPTSYSRITLSHIMSTVDVNLYGTVHGGVIMKLMDDAAAAVAARHSGGNAVTAAIDEIVFMEPVRVGDLVSAHAQVNWTGKSSMEVGVRVLAERWDRAGIDPVRVATAYITFVGVDATGRPRQIPAVRPETAEDLRRFREAKIRREHRLAGRTAILSSRGEGEPRTQG